MTPAMKIHEDMQIEHMCHLHDTATQQALRPDLVYGTTDKDTHKLTWELVEITCPWPWTDNDVETLEKAYRKMAGKYDQLRQELAEAHLEPKIEQATIVSGANGVFHKRSQVESAKATRLKGKDSVRL
jgi:hypothetical protein